MVNKDTQLLFSIASNPGNMGATVYNELFKYHNINAIYKPLKCSSDDEFVKLIEALKTIGALGVSVSMPFKKLLFKLYELRCGNFETGMMKSANTLKLQTDKCYNTDIFGFTQGVDKLIEPEHTVVIIGNGGLSTAIYRYLWFAREDMEDVRVLKKEHMYLLNEPIYYNDMRKTKWLINCTPIGMDHVPDEYFTFDNTRHFSYIVNPVIKRNTNLQQLANRHGVYYLSGHEFFVNQLEEQFNIYFGFKPNRAQVTEIVGKL